MARAGVLAFLPAIAVAFACATVDPPPFCAETAGPPVATEACLAAPDGERVARELAGLIDESAGPYRVEVAFDGSGAVASVCTRRSPAGDPWAPRARLAEKKAAILGIAGAPCLAGARLDLNRRGAKLAEITAVHAHCEHEATQLVETASPQIAARSRDVRRRRCIEQEQVERDEIWMVSLGLVLEREEGGDDRRAALLACTTVAEPAEPTDAATDDGQVDAPRLDPETVAACMRDHGWRSAL